MSNYLKTFIVLEETEFIPGIKKQNDKMVNYKHMKEALKIEEIPAIIIS